MAKDITQLVPDIKSRLKDFKKRVESVRELHAIGIVLVRRIRTRTLLGYGVEQTGASRSPLDPLSPNYKKWRSKNRKDLGSKARPNKSNLTLTGEMLKSLYAQGTQGRITIAARGVTNQKKITWNETPYGNKPARVFLNLSDNDLKVIEEHFYRILRDTLL